MTITELKQMLTTAIKNKEELPKRMIRLIIGEFERLNSPSEEDARITKAIEKIITGNEETLSYAENEELTNENEYLKSLLPKKITKEEINTILAEIAIEIKEMKSDGQAVGFAMKKMKSTGNFYDSIHVISVVKEIREN